MPEVAILDSGQCQENHSVAARDPYLTMCAAPVFVLCAVCFWVFPQMYKLNAERSKKYIFSSRYFQWKVWKKNLQELLSVSNNPNYLYHQMH